MAQAKIRTKKVYILDHSQYKGPETQKMTHEKMMDMLSKILDDRELEISRELLSSSCVSENAYAPAGYFEHPLALSMEKGRQEIKDVFKETVAKLLERSGVAAKELDFVITAGTVFSTVPSMSATLCNLFGTRNNVIAYHLSGLGDSVGLIAISTVAKLLREQKKAGYGIVMLHENLSTLLYPGKDEKFLESNVMLREGGAAILLSSVQKDSVRAKYEFITDAECAPKLESLQCDQLLERYTNDSEGFAGICKGDPVKWQPLLKQSVMDLKTSLDAKMKHTQSQTIKGHKVLETEEYASAQGCLSRLLKSPSAKPLAGVEKGESDILPGTIDHYIVQPKSLDIIQRLAEAMGLCTMTDCESSLHALYHYGDTACSGVWYALAHKESIGNMRNDGKDRKRIKKGESIMLLGLSGTLRTHGVILRACQDINSTQDTWENSQNDEASAAIQCCLEGGKCFLNIPSKLSEKEKCLRQSENPFFPFLHPIGQVDTERFIADA